MIVLVSGDRHWSDKEFIKNALRGIGTVSLGREESIEAIFEGGATGADALSHEVGDELGIPVFELKANWAKEGNAAGPIRNAQMLKFGHIDLVLAFHDDIEHSKGTRDMIDKAIRAKVRVILYSHKGTFDIPVQCLQCSRYFLIDDGEAIIGEPKLCSEKCALDFSS